MNNHRRTIVYALALAGAGLLFYWVLSDTSPEAPETGTPSVDGAAARPPRATPAEGWRPDSGPRQGQLRVAGTVRDGDSRRGVAGAKVVLKQASGAELSAVSNAKGRFELELEPGSYRASVSAEHYVAPSAPIDLQLEPVDGTDRTTPLELVLLRAARVAGRVVDAHARPLAGVSVVLHRARGRAGLRIDAATAPEVNTDPRGRFALEVPPAEVVLRASLPARGVALSAPLYLRPGTDVGGVEITLGGGLSLAGQVVGPGGRRVGAGARVTLSDEHGPRTIACDEEGRFTSANLSPGKKLLQAMAAGFSPSRITAVIVRAAASAKIVLTLASKQLVAGIVVDAAGQPVPGAEVRVRPGSPRRRPTHLLSPLSTTSDSLGRFEVIGVPDVPLLVTAKGAGNNRASRAGVAPGTRNVRLRLQATGGIAGRVSDGRSGRPVRSFTVTAQPFDPGVSTQVRVLSPDGRYHLRKLVAGRYKLTFTVPGYAPTVVTRVDVVEGSDVAAHAVLDGGGQIAGVVVDRQGMTLPGARVKMETGWAGDAVVTGSAGSFVIDGVARGRRSLTVSHPQHDTRIVTGISVFAGQRASVRVELSRRAGRGAALRLTGIGAVLAERKGGLTVLKVLPGSPALVANLLAGDVIVRIEGREGLGFGEAIEAIRGLPGTPVRLAIKRRNEAAFELDIVRGEVSVPRRQ